MGLWPVVKTVAEDFQTARLVENPDMRAAGRVVSDVVVKQGVPVASTSTLQDLCKECKYMVAMY